MTKAIIVEDQRTVCDAFTVLVKSLGIEVAGAASTVAEAIALIERERPDIIFLDLHLSERNDGFRVLAHAKRQLPATQVIAVSASNNPVQATAFLNAGGTAYVTKSAGLGELKRALLALRRGGRYVSRDVAPQSRAAAIREQPVATDDPVEALTPRERHVLTLLACGLSCKEVAAQLGISYPTAAQYRRQLRIKLGVRTDAALARLVTERGLDRMGPSGPLP